jgi:transposase
MTEELTIRTERVDDIPLLLAHGERMGIPRLLGEHFPTHGNWGGLSLGYTALGWLAHILSESDHRMNHVQAWAGKRLETLNGCMGKVVSALDFGDDRLANILHMLSDDERWSAFERALNGRLLRVYTLRPEVVRVDSTTASGYWGVSEEGLFQFGHSKDHRPDLPQVKVVLSTLDPFGMPVATNVVSGQRADDPLYVPAIQQVREGLGSSGLLYVGDCKMAALATRAFVQAGGDYYLTPLPKAQLPEEELDDYLSPVWCGKQTLTSVYREGRDGKRECIAEGYEREVVLVDQVDGQTITWIERRLVIRSLSRAQAAETLLWKRLNKARNALDALNERGRGKKRYRHVAELEQAAEAILKKHKVQGLLRLHYEVGTHTREVRGYGGRPTRTVIDTDTRVIAVVNDQAVQDTLQREGWRVYATNASAERLPLTQAVLAYRDQYIVERGYGRLKGHPLSLSPMYVARDDHATGLIRLLSVALRVLTLLEFVVRRQLAEEGTELAGLYAGNPKRTTARPTAERLLEAFKEITLTVVQESQRTIRHLTPLSAVQGRILALVDFSTDVYTRLAVHSLKPP